MYIKVYVAGAISDPNPAKMLGNLRKGMREATRLLLRGYIPFCPFLDHQFFFQLQNGEEISVEQIQTYSIEWLKVCDVVYVMPNSENSIGTQREIETAMGNTPPIPVVYNEEELQCVRTRLMGIRAGA